MRRPEGADFLQGVVGEGHTAVFVAFALIDVQLHPGAVDFTDTQASRFAHPQSTGIDRVQAGAVVRATQTAQHLPHFLDAQHNRQFLLRFGTQQIEDLPLTFEGEGVKELDAALATGHQTEVRSERNGDGIIKGQSSLNPIPS